MKKGIVIESSKDYHESKEILSKSILSNMSICPQFFKYRLDNPKESDDLVFGAAFHKLVLEPQDFDKEFVVMPNFDRRTKQGKSEYEKFILENVGKDIISLDQYETICGMRDSVMSNKLAVALLNGNHEHSFYYVDEFTGVPCKVRPDCYRFADDILIIVDLKSCRSAMPKDFIKSVIDYFYDLQTAMYTDGASKTLNIPIEKIKFVFIVVEKTPPYLTAIYETTKTIYERGEALFREYVGTYKYCLETNNWYGINGYSYEPMLLGLPDWATKNKGE